VWGKRSSALNVTKAPTPSDTQTRPASRRNRWDTPAASPDLLFDRGQIHALFNCGQPFAMNHRSSVELQPLAKRQGTRSPPPLQSPLPFVRPSFRSFILVSAFGGCRGAGFGKSLFPCNRVGPLGVLRCGMDDDVQSLLQKHRYRQAFRTSSWPFRGEGISNGNNVLKGPGVEPRKSRRTYS